MIAFVLAALAAQSELEIAPWNGKKGAVSLTFDDGDPSHLDTAIPELDKRGLKGTFFLIASKIDRPAEWKKAAAAGHEIASHSTSHKNPGEVKSEADLAKEVDAAAKTLEAVAGRAPSTFAYPFAQLSPALKERVGKVHLLARGGGGPVALAATAEPDWLNIGSQATMTPLPLETYTGWVDQAATSGGWAVLMIHGLEGTPWGWQPIPKKTYAGLLDHLKKADVWTAPFGEVGAYWKGRKLLEAAKATSTPAGKRWTWELPPHFPPGIALKVRARGALQQKGATLTADKDGWAALKLDERELILK